LDRSVESARSGYGFGFEADQERPGLDSLAGGAFHGLDASLRIGSDFVLHLHGLEDQEGRPGSHHVAGSDPYLDHTPRDLRSDFGRAASRERGFRGEIPQGICELQVKAASSHPGLDPAVAVRGGAAGQLTSRRKDYGPPTVGELRAVGEGLSLRPVDGDPPPVS
jgi:hypothetical protein